MQAKNIVMSHAAKNVICAMQPLLHGNKSPSHFYKAVAMMQSFVRYMPMISGISTSQKTMRAKTFFNSPRRQTDAFDTLMIAYFELAENNTYFKSAAAKYPSCVAILETEFKDLLAAGIQSCSIQSPDLFALNGLLSIIAQCKNSIEESDQEAINALNKIEDMLNNAVDCAQEFLSPISPNDEESLIDSCCQTLTSIQSMMNQIVFVL